MNKLSIIMLLCLLGGFGAQAQWQNIRYTPSGRHVDIHFWDKDAGIVCGVGFPYIVKTYDGGQHWDTVRVDFLDNTTANLTEMQFVDRNLGFICGGSGFSPYMNILMRTKDGGNSWDSLIVNYPGAWEFSGIDIHAYDTELVGVVHGYNNLYKIADSGRRLEQLPLPAPNIGVITEAKIVKGNTLLLCTGTEIYKTHDWGNTWAQVYSDTVFFGKMAFHETKGICIGEEGWILRTNNLGDWWEKEKIASDSAMFYTLTYAPNGDAFILGSIAREGYVYGFGNEGRYWSQVLVSPNFEYFADISMPTADTGYIVTNHEVIKTTSGGGLALAVENASPGSDVIQLYPNPANTLLNIRAPKDHTMLGVAVYDMAGKLMRQNEVAVSSLDVSGLPMGSYLIKIQTDKGDYSKRIIVQ